MIAPLELDYEPEGLPAFDLPQELAALYPGTFGFPATRLYANFVETLDGVVAIPSVPSSNRLIAGESAADRFVMGMLRAAADAVVVGSGTLAAAPSSLWTPERAYPDAARGYAQLRSRLGRKPEPELVVLTASGHVDPHHPAIAAGALLLTTDDGAARLAPALPDAATAVSLGKALDAAAVLDTLHERGHASILTEGGPRVLGSLLRAGVVDELFLTLSPLLAGRPQGQERPAMVEGADLLRGGALPGGRLTGVRRDADHLFLRYSLA